MTDLVRVERLVKTFGASGRHGAKSAIRALGGVDLRVGEGEIFGLIGPDGAGKTTFLRILAGLLAPGEGNVSVFGLPLPENAEKVRDSLGYMSQKFSLYPDLTVAENLAFFADIYGIPAADLGVRLDRLYAMTRLGEFRDRPAGKLSGGMKQKLALMCTLVPRPRLLLLDEPTTGVDPISRREFWEILQTLLAEGVTILTSTPYMDEAEWCTRIGLLHQGVFLACASPRELKEKIGVATLEAEVPAGGDAVLPQISASDGVLDLHRLGNRIRVTSRDADSASRLVTQFAARIDLRPVSPTVEDVFLAGIRGA